MTINRLLLLFTYGGRLENWEELGLIDRELAYYEKMFDAGLKHVDLMTYGHGKTKKRIDQRFRVLPKKWVKHELIYSFLAPFACWSAFKKCDIMKTNQSQGAWVGWLVKAMMWQKKLVVRCGWVRTKEMMQKDEGRSGLNLWWHQVVERLAFTFANAIIVVSKIDRDYICKHYGISKNKFTIIPNSIDISLYQYKEKEVSPALSKRILLIGRLVEMKNYQNLLKAADGLKEISEVVIAGDGPYRKELENIAESVNVDVRFLSAIPNHQIPMELEQADIFVLPQFYASGMPKVILEAMAVGTPVVCSDILVHRNLIENGGNGFLCGNTVDSIRRVLVQVCNMSDNQRKQLIRKARMDVEVSHDMAINAQRELALFDSLVN